MEIVRKYFYYLRNKMNEPVITICLGFDCDDIAYRGISICSAKDNPIKKRGKSISFGRMIKAFHNEMNSDEIDKDEPMNVLISVRENMNEETEKLFFNEGSFLNTFSYKSEVNPELTQYENKLKNLKE